MPNAKRVTMIESAARHLRAGVTEAGDLARLIAQDTGASPSAASVREYLKFFREHGTSWADVIRRSRQAASLRHRARNLATYLFTHTSVRARRSGLEWGITRAEIEAMLRPMTCSATGLPLSVANGGPTRANPWMPSIDRIDCSRGYVPGNVRVVCWAFNLMRSDWPDDVVLTLAKALAARAA